MYLLATHPHGSCLLWNPWLTTLHVTSDALIALAYFSIPVMLQYYRTKGDIPFRFIKNTLIWFAAFILSCGFGHVLDAWNIWSAHYWLSGIEKALTAGVSLWTAFILFSEIPRLIRLGHDAAHDPLTGLLNRRGLYDSLELAMLEQLPHVLLCLDLDKFKAVNDTYGHPRGDTLLQEVARAIQDNIRASDIAARTGGDEFVVLLRGCNTSNALPTVNKIRDAIAATELVTASIGLKEVLPPVESVEQLMSDADRALYRAKAQGGGRCSVG